MGEVSKHAKYSPSKSKQWLECPGSMALSDKAPPPRESEYALEGTAAHECLEFLLKNNNKPLAAAGYCRRKYGTQITAHGEWAVKEIMKLKVKGALVLSETKSDMTHIDPGFYGTTDAAIVDLFGTLHVIDFKYGVGIAVDAEENTQMLAYSIGIAHAHDYNFENVCMTILQPRAAHPNGPVRSWTIPIEQLKNWESNFEYGIEQCKKPDAPLRPGDWCRFCSASCICPEISKKALVSAQIAFDDQTGVVKTPPIASLDPVGISKALAALDLIDVWAKALRAVAYDTLKRGAVIPGFKLVERRATRKWADEGKTIKEAQKRFGSKAFTSDLLSPAQLEKVVGKEWVKSRVVAISSGLTMVADDDKRQGTNAIEQAFGE